jgi:hypothetical protein
MDANCPNCDTQFTGCDRDEDGVPEVPDTVKCAVPECEVYLCQAGCEHLSFLCSACNRRFCYAHTRIQIAGDSFCGDCNADATPARKVA